MQANFKSHDHYFYTKKGWVKLDLNQKNSRQGRYGEFLGDEEDIESINSGLSTADCRLKADKLIELTRRMRRTRWAAREIRRVDLELGLTSLSDSSLRKNHSATTEISSVSEYDPSVNSLLLPSGTSSIPSSEILDYEQSHVITKFTSQTSKPSSAGSAASKVNNSNQPKINKSTDSIKKTSGKQELLKNNSLEASTEDQINVSDHPATPESDSLGNPFHQEVTVGMIKVVHGLDRMDSAFADNLENLIITDKLPKRSVPTPERSVIENPFSSEDSFSLTREFAHSQRAKKGDGSDNVSKLLNNSSKEKTKKKKYKKEERKLKKFMTNFRFYCVKEEGQLERVQQDEIDPSTFQAIPKHCSELMDSKGFTNFFEKAPEVTQKKDSIKEETNFERCMREVAEAYKTLEETEKSKEVTDVESEEGKDNIQGSDQFILDPGSSEYTFEEEDEFKSKPVKMTLKQKLFQLLIKRIFDRTINVKGKQTTIRDIVGSEKEKEFMALKPLELELTRQTGAGDKRKNLSIDMTHNESLVKSRDVKISIYEAPVFNVEESIEESLEKIISENWRTILEAAKKSVEKALKTKVKQTEKNKCEKERYVLKKKDKTKKTISAMEKALDELIDKILAESNFKWDEDVPEGVKQTDTLYVRAKAEQPTQTETMLDWPKVQSKKNRKAMITDLTYKELWEALKTTEEDKRIHKRRTEKDFTFEGRGCEEEEVLPEEEKRNGVEESCPKAGKFTYLYPDDMAISKGPVKFMSGVRYNGMWNKVGLKACCLYRTPGGIIIKCVTDDGLFSGDTTAYFPNGTTLRGEFDKGVFKPKEYTFEDGLTYEGEDWSYLKWPDRRFHSEIVEGKEPIGKQRTNTVPSRKIPPGCYDTGEGYYCPATKCIHHPHTLQPIRVAKPSEVAWIVNACRKGWDDCEPLSRRAHEYKYPSVYGKFPTPWQKYDSTQQPRPSPNRDRAGKSNRNETLDKWMQVNRKGADARAVVRQLDKHYDQYQPMASLKQGVKPPPATRPRKHRSTCKYFYRDLYTQIKHQDDFQLLSVYKKFI